MPDREKVIKELEDSLANQGCGYMDGVGELYAVSGENLQNAIDLLKEQEPKQVGLYGKEDWYGLVCVCPDCKAVWMSGESETHFCPNCGRPVKWE